MKKAQFAEHGLIKIHQGWFGPEKYAMYTLTDKELTIIDRIGNNSGKITQREIAKNTGLSLGLTNIILKRLTKKGYIKIKQLTPKKIQYILTTKGIEEQTQKSYRYIFKTINEVKNIKRTVNQIMSAELKNGSTRFGIIGDNEIADIAEIASRTIEGITVKRCDKSDGENVNVFIDCYTEADVKPESVDGVKTIKLIDLITKGGG